MSPAEAGRLAEQKVNGWERSRVAGLGHDPSVVRWISLALPSADHDFESVDEAGQPTVIEVKAVASTGAFIWTIREFTLASTAADHYWLYLVFGVSSEQAQVYRLQNPIAAIEEGRIELETRQLTARLIDPSQR